MDTQTIERPLAEFLEAISKQIQVQELIVFGSHLEGAATEDSDIDVFVVSEDFAIKAFTAGLTEDQRLDILEVAADGIEPAIHAWGFTPDEVQQASELTTLGYAREAGLRFTLTQEAAKVTSHG